MNFTLDTYAWIEYFEGTKEGGNVREILENEKHNLFTPSIVLAELSDTVFKGKIKVDWNDLIKFVTLNT